MRRLSRWGLRLAFSVTAAVLVCNAALTAINLSSLIRANRELDQSGELINVLEHTQSLLREAESSHRGLLLTGAAAESARFEDATYELGKGLDGLAGLSVDRPDQARRIGELRPACVAYLKVLRRAGPGTAAPGEDASAIREAKADVDRRVAQIWEAEDDEIEARLAAREAAILWGCCSLAISGGFSLILLAGTWMLARRELGARERAADAERASREAMQAASRAKDRMLAVIGHELRTPLTPILMEVSSLQHDARYQELHPAFETIRRLIELEVRLVDDLIDLAMLEQGRLGLERRPVDVHEAIRRAVKLCSDSGMTRERRLNVQLTARRHHVEGDLTRIQQIVWNLLRNALDHVSTVGIVEIRTRDRQVAGASCGTLIVEVEDDGAGIDEADLGRIFSAFERGRTENRPGGLGLGLAIAQHLAAAHGGSLSVASSGPGRGATFALELPALEAAPEIAHATPSMTPPPPPGSLQILLVEDHAESRNVIATALRRRGHQVLDVSRIREAVAAAAVRDFDLILSDLELPDGSGLDLMHALSGRGLRAIALSGYATDEDRERSIAAGFVEHLAKPVTLDALELAIHRVAAVAPADLRAASL